MDTPPPDPGAPHAQSDNLTVPASNPGPPDEQAATDARALDPVQLPAPDEGLYRVFVSEIDHVHYVSVSEAARLVGRHPNTIRYRLKTGRYPARKVLTSNGEAYLIPRAALEEPAPPARDEAGLHPPTGPLDHGAQLEEILGRVAGELARQLAEPVRAELAATQHTLERLSKELGVEQHAHYTEKARREAAEIELRALRETKRGWLRRLFGAGQ